MKRRLLALPLILVLLVLVVAASGSAAETCPEGNGWRKYEGEGKWSTSIYTLEVKGSTFKLTFDDARYSFKVCVKAATDVFRFNCSTSPCSNDVGSHDISHVSVKVDKEITPTPYDTPTVTPTIPRKKTPTVTGTPKKQNTPTPTPTGDRQPTPTPTLCSPCSPEVCPTLPCCVPIEDGFVFGGQGIDVFLFHVEDRTCVISVSSGDIICWPTCCGCECP